MLECIFISTICWEENKNEIIKPAHSSVKCKRESQDIRLSVKATSKNKSYDWDLCFWRKSDILGLKIFFSHSFSPWEWFGNCNVRGNMLRKRLIVTAIYILHKRHGNGKLKCCRIVFLLVNIFYFLVLHYT